MADQFVHPDGSGRWLASGELGSQRRSSHTTQSDAIATARDRCAASGGGKVILLGDDGKPRATQTVAAGPAALGWAASLEDDIDTRGGRRHGPSRRADAMSL